MEFDIVKHTIFLVLSGSHAYGMARPESDIDVRGVLIPPSEYFHGYLKRFEQFEGQIPRGAKFDPGCAATFGDCLKAHIDRPIPDGEEIDSVVYDIRKFFRLCADCNPSLIEMLFTDESCRIWATPLSDQLVEHRNLFLSTKATFSFNGYAASQLKRIKRHRAWLLSPPDHQPTRGEFGLPEHTVMPRDQLMAAESLITRKIEEWLGSKEELPKEMLLELRQRTVGAIRDIWAALEADRITVSAACERLSSLLPPPITEDGDLDEGRIARAAGKLLGYDSNFLELLDRERGYRSASKHFQQYQEWKRSRNPARAELETKHGFDSKHASHLVRLLKMSKEIVELGKVIVRRPDADELLAIRNGAWTYDQLIEWADRQETEVHAIYESGRSPLPKKPDHVRLDALCQRMVEEAWR